MGRLEKKRIFIQTYGCQMNVHDSEKIVALMEKSGYESCDDVRKADLIIINTCSIREKAAQEIKTIKKKKSSPHSRRGGVSCSAVGFSVH